MESPQRSTPAVMPPVIQRRRHRSRLQHPVNQNVARVLNFNSISEPNILTPQKTPLPRQYDTSAVRKLYF